MTFKHLLILVLSILTIQINAQNFLRFFDSETYNSVNVKNIVKLSNGDYIVHSNSQVSGTFEISNVLIRMDSEGEVISARHSVTPNATYSNITALENGSYLYTYIDFEAFSDSPFFAQYIDVDDDIVWSKKIVTTGSSAVLGNIHKGIQDAEGNIYLIGNVDIEQSAVVKISIDGDVIWNRIFNASIFSASNGAPNKYIKSLQDESILVYGASYFSDAELGECIIINLDITGEVISSIKIGAEIILAWITHVEVLDNGDYFVCGSAEDVSSSGNNGLFFRMTPEGEIIWQKQISLFDDFNPRVVFKNNENTYTVLSLGVGGPNFFDLVEFTMNENGDVLESFYAPYGGRVSLQHATSDNIIITEAINDGLSFSETVIHSFQPDEFELCYEKLIIEIEELEIDLMVSDLTSGDELDLSFENFTFDWIAGDAVSIEPCELIGVEINVEEIETENRIEVYPNPTSGEIQVFGDLKGLERIEIIDCNGKIIAKYLERINFINLDKFPTGVYFLRSYFKETVETSKIIIQK